MWDISPFKNKYTLIHSFLDFVSLFLFSVPEAPFCFLFTKFAHFFTNLLSVTFLFRSVFFSLSFFPRRLEELLPVIFLFAHNHKRFH